MAKGQVQRRYLDRAESTSLCAILPPVGGPDWVSAASRTSASVSIGERRVCGRLLHRVRRRTLLLKWSLGSQRTCSCGDAASGMLSQEKREGIRQSRFRAKRTPP